MTIGDKYDDEIFEHILECEVCIFFRSPNSLKSDYCHKEINYARKKEKIFFSIVIEESELPPWYEGLFSDYQEIIYTNDNDDLYEKLSTVNNLLKKCEREDYIPSKDEFHSTREVKKKLGLSEKRRAAEEKERKVYAEKEKKLGEKQRAIRDIEEGEEDIKNAEQTLTLLKQENEKLKNFHPKEELWLFLAVVLPIITGLSLIASLFWIKDDLELVNSFCAIAGLSAAGNIALICVLFYIKDRTSANICRQLVDFSLFFAVSVLFSFASVDVALLVDVKLVVIILWILFGIFVLTSILICFIYLPRTFDKLISDSKKIANYKDEVKIQNTRIKDAKEKIKKAKKYLLLHKFF